ncbi:MAG: hypothetical protein R3E65_11435 [Steroidobacteraceae bacterium]
MTASQSNRPRVPAGARPVFLGDGVSETLLGMLLALATETSALADEIDDLREALREARGDGRSDPTDIESRRVLRRRAMIERMLRIVQEGLGSQANEQRNAAYREFVEQLSR